MTAKIPKEFGVFIEGEKSPIATAPSRLLARCAMRQLPPPKKVQNMKLPFGNPFNSIFSTIGGANA